MKIYIIIPAYNEGKYLARTLNSIVVQTRLPDRVVIVNDNSTDNTQQIITEFTNKYAFVHSVNHSSEAIHKPGSKVVNAFYKGFETLANDFQFIGKFDADIVLPSDYFEKTLHLFASEEKIGIAGGNLYVSKNETWVYENISEKTKVRGPIKLYRKECFDQIGGLRSTIGWDTIDELLAQFYGWKIKTDEKLHVKHLKPTGEVYTKISRFKQGEAFYKMHYGLLLTGIASAKLAIQKRSFRFFMDCLRGYFTSKKNGIEYAVSIKEGEFIRKLRWKNIQKKLF